MKKKASSVVKNIISFISSITTKAKADATRARLVLLSLLKTETRSVSSLISHKMQTLLDKKSHQDLEDVECRAIVLHNKSPSLAPNTSFAYYDDVDVHDEFPDLNHSLFEDEDDDDLGQQGDGSVIDMVKNSKENQGQDFVLENEIDNVADLFIKRFKKQIRLQKLESFKRFQQMMERSE